MTPILKLDFTLRQGAFVLDVHETIDAALVALFGPSGAGKTTMLDAIAGLRTPERGEIAVGGRPLYSFAERIDLPPRHRGIGYVPQDVVLFPHMNVRRNIMYGAARGSRVSVDRVLAILEIDTLLDREVAALSGGERQRVALARALVSSPDLLLLDEPLVAVDAALRGRILPYLSRVRDELRVPVVYVTHDAADVRTLAEWVLRIDSGTVRARGAPEHVVNG